MPAHITDLKGTAKGLAEMLQNAKTAKDVEAVAELSAMLARIEDKIGQFEEADELLDEAEELEEKYEDKY